MYTGVYSVYACTGTVVYMHVYINGHHLCVGFYLYSYHKPYVHVAITGMYIIV